LGFLRKFFNLENENEDNHSSFGVNTQFVNKSQPHKNSKRKRTYQGPYFAQPGEISELFGYANFKDGKILQAPYSIIDIETSHLSPNFGHIIEIAILKVDKMGKKVKEFSTLINPPDGKVGATDIHGIRKEDIKKAPLFSEIVGNIFSILSNSIVVAHNAKFEEGFLKKEFGRIGHKIPVIPALDTLWLSRQVIDLENYKLKTVVSGYGHRMVNAHTALGDTRAVAKILPKMLSKADDLKYPIQLQTLPKIKNIKNIKTR
jgi:DNA polymerase-3 subunit epsilon